MSWLSPFVFVSFVALISSTTQDFPLIEFFKSVVPNAKVPAELTGLKSKYLCSGGPTTNVEKCCNCHDKCLIEGSCCIDKLWNSTNPLPLEKYLNIFQQRFDDVSISCLPALPYASQYTQTFYSMVDKCNEDKAEQQDIQRCQNDEILNDFERVPVHGSDSKLYKNRYCARCNLIKQYRTVDLHLSCRGGPSEHKIVPFLPSGVTTTTTTRNPNENILDKFSGCTVSISKVGPCKSSNFPASTFKCKNLAFKKYCQMYKGKYGNDKNLHCHVCNNKGAFTEDILMNMATESCYLTLPGAKTTWSVTISFTSGTTKIKTSGQSSGNLYEYCRAGEMYSITEGKCIAFTCAPGYRVKGTECIQEINFQKSVLVTNPGFAACLIEPQANLYVVFPSNHQLVGVKKFEANFANYLRTPNTSFVVLNATNQLILKWKTPIKPPQNFSSIEKVLKNQSLSIWKYDIQVFISSVDITKVNQFYGFDLTRYYLGGKICADTQSYKIVDGHFTNQCEFKLSNKSNRLQQKDFILHQSFTKESTSSRLDHCKSFHLPQNCPRVEVSTNVTFNRSTNSIILHSIQNETVILNQTEFLPFNNQTFLICFVSNQRSLTNQNVYTWQEKLNVAEFYLSIILVIISIAFGFLFLITFVLFSELRNKGSTNVFFMSILILTNDITYIFAVFLGEKNSHACKILGMLLHFGLFLTGLWAFSLAFDLVTTFFRKRKNRSVVFVRKQFIFRVVVCVLVALLMIVICISLNETKTIDFKYGSNNICWIGNHFPRLYFYLLPTTFFFLVGIICLSSVLWHLYKQEKDQRKALKNSGRTNIDLVTICLKLFVLLGLAEAIGLVQIYKIDLSENEMIFNATFGFVYTILRSIRGTLVFWMYLGNEKTLTLYKKKISVAESETDTLKLTQISRLGISSVSNSPAPSLKTLT